MVEWPAWWEWELEFSPHLMRRMSDRKFTEIDIRAMMQNARKLRKDIDPGRWVVETGKEAQDWEIIVEPDVDDRLLVVVTAFKVENQ